ncbi:MAG: diguanylate cyclase domain-containing protein [Coprobacillus cateniformis]
MTGGIFLFWYRHKQKQIQKVMYIDKLTGIYNLLSFEIEVQKQIENQKEFSYVLICFDIDDFKFYNTIWLCVW